MQPYLATPASGVGLRAMAASPSDALTAGPSQLGHYWNAAELARAADLEEQTLWWTGKFDTGQIGESMVA